MPVLPALFARAAAEIQCRKQALALDIHLDNVGIRKIARFTGAAPATIITWIRKAHDAMVGKKALAPINETASDIIEMDEIYTFVKKTAPGRYLDGL